MAGVKGWLVLLVVLVSAAAGGKRVSAQVHHVVGGDRGWEPSTDLASWFTDREFKVGDILWFAYSAAQESVVELQTLKEFVACDLRNPIRMYNGGLDKISLQDQGVRYFASGNIESCKKGLKLPVTVNPEGLTTASATATATAAAAAPTIPSAATQVTALSSTLFVGFVVLCYFGL